MHDKKDRIKKRNDHRKRTGNKKKENSCEETEGKRNKE
jgi:hypothetical protein